MNVYEIVAQGIGIVAMTINILSFQQKEQRNIIFMQIFGSALFAVNMFMLGAVAGGIMNLIGAFRAIVYSNKKTFRADSKWWIVGFTFVCMVFYVLTFTTFGKEPTAVNCVVEFLPMISMFVTNIGFACKDAKTVRKLSLVSCPPWLAYNIFNFVIGGMICDVLNMVSIIIGMLRHDIRRKNNDT
jgi:hypothetical protein